MSLHPSLKKRGSIKAKRSVLKRFERVDLLKEKGRWTEETGKVFGLPKTKNEE